MARPKRKRSSSKSSERDTASRSPKQAGHSKNEDATKTPATPEKSTSSPKHSPTIPRTLKSRTRDEHQGLDDPDSPTPRPDKHQRMRGKGNRYGRGEEKDGYRSDYEDNNEEEEDDDVEMDGADGGRRYDGQRDDDQGGGGLGGGTGAGASGEEHGGGYGRDDRHDKNDQKYEAKDHHGTSSNHPYSQNQNISQYTTTIPPPNLNLNLNLNTTQPLTLPPITSLLRETTTTTDPTTYIWPKQSWHTPEGLERAGYGTLPWYTSQPTEECVGSMKDEKLDSGYEIKTPPFHPETHPPSDLRPQERKEGHTAEPKMPLLPFAKEVEYEYEDDYESASSACDCPKCVPSVRNLLNPESGSAVASKPVGLGIFLEGEMEWGRRGVGCVEEQDFGQDNGNQGMMMRGGLGGRECEGEGGDVASCGTRSSTATADEGEGREDDCESGSEESGGEEEMEMEEEREESVGEAASDPEDEDYQTSSSSSSSSASSEHDTPRWKGKQVVIRRSKRLRLRSRRVVGVRG